MAEKKKLTLSVDSEIIENFKKLNINISGIVESAMNLTNIRNNSEIVPTSEVRKAWISILEEINLIITKWDTRLLIGSIFDSDHEYEAEYYLDKGKIIFYENTGPYGTVVCSITDEKLPINSFFDIDNLLKSLAETLINKSNKNKETLEKLELLKNILKLSALSK